MGKANSRLIKVLLLSFPSLSPPTLSSLIFLEAGIQENSYGGFDVFGGQAPVKAFRDEMTLQVSVIAGQWPCNRLFTYQQGK